MEEEATPYEAGYAEMRVRIEAEKPSVPDAYDWLADLRARRAALDPGSAAWMRLVGCSTALLRAYPMLAAHYRRLSVVR